MADFNAPARSLATVVLIMVALVALAPDVVLGTAGVSVTVARFDLLDAHTGGNKGFKLREHLHAAQAGGYTRLLTFGGAWSNHLRAVAAAGARAGLATVGIVRGEPTEPLNPSLQFCQTQGMELVWWDRTTYRRKHEPELLGNLQRQYGPAWVIPEGGHSPEGVRGAMDMYIPGFDAIFCACGTGSTLAGLIAASESPVRLYGVATLKGGDFLYREVGTALGWVGATETPGRWQILTDYHFGGYGRSRPELDAFIHLFQQRYGIPLEPVYTGKLFFALSDQLQKGLLPPGSRVLVLHTGGVFAAPCRD
jgi:1-aminocyclopropane-1-carboxylate deaminase